MSEIKSAWQKAMEKVENLPKPSQEELRRLEYVPAGNKLAARFLNENNIDLSGELERYSEAGGRREILEGAQEILLRNILLPRDARAKEINKKAMTGLKVIKQNQRKLEEIFSLINNLLNYYDQSRQQAYNQVKQNFENKVKEMAKAQQSLTAKVPSQAELQAQLQQEWREINADLDAQYQQVLEEHKQQIAKLN